MDGVCAGQIALRQGVTAIRLSTVLELWWTRIVPLFVRLTERLAPCGCQRSKEYAHVSTESYLRRKIYAIWNRVALDSGG